MVNLSGTISRLNPCRVLVAGDLILDAYTVGKARRISPEAPVAILNVQREEKRPGGAGNVALNLVSLGATVTLMSRVGRDFAGESLLEFLETEKIDVSGVVVQSAYPTPYKNRIIADNQQIVRIDHEQVLALDEELESEMIRRIPYLLEDIQVVAISDYGKGCLTKRLLQALIVEAKLRGIPVIADPKGIDFSKYNGTTILKPNLSETYAAANVPLETPIEEAAAKVLQLLQAETLMVTRSEAGISLFHRNGEHQNFPVRVREVKDVTGAGDTVLAVLAAALANDLELDMAVQLSNVAAGIAIERFGCARISISDLARRLLVHNTDNKIFDSSHLFVLKQALQGHPYAVLEISGSHGLTSEIFKAIRHQKLHHQADVMLFIRDPEPDPDFIHLLSSLHEVDFILICRDSLSELTQNHPPLQSIVV